MPYRGVSFLPVELWQNSSVPCVFFLESQYEKNDINTIFLIDRRRDGRFPPKPINLVKTSKTAGGIDEIGIQMEKKYIENIGDIILVKESIKEQRENKKPAVYRQKLLLGFITLN